MSYWLKTKLRSFSWVIFILYLIYSVLSVAAVKNEYLHEASI